MQVLARVGSTLPRLPVLTSPDQSQVSGAEGFLLEDRVPSLISLGSTTSTVLLKKDLQSPDRRRIDDVDA